MVCFNCVCTHTHTHHLIWPALVHRIAEGCSFHPVFPFQAFLLHTHLTQCGLSLPGEHCRKQVENGARVTRCRVLSLETGQRQDSHSMWGNSSHLPKHPSGRETGKIRAEAVNWPGRKCSAGLEFQNHTCCCFFHNGNGNGVAESSTFLRTGCRSLG